MCLGVYAWVEKCDMVALDRYEGYVSCVWGQSLLLLLISWVKEFSVVTCERATASLLVREIIVLHCLSLIP
jgi:hypothetical protein